MTKLQAFRAFRAALRDPERIGDAAVYKSELSGARARPAIEAELAGLADTFPQIELAPLRALPRGTLGREYAELLQANHLQPFRISDELPRDVLRRNIFTARYALLHDVYHVLTGFDTSWAGEAGVWAFVAAQRYAFVHWIAVALACVVYPILAPRQTLEVWRNAILGARMGRRATVLITLPVQQSWELSVEELRASLRIEASPSPPNGGRPTAPSRA